MYFLTMVMSRISLLLTFKTATLEFLLLQQIHNLGPKNPMLSFPEIVAVVCYLCHLSKIILWQGKQL